jgi:hypothetical protein
LNKEHHRDHHSIITLFMIAAVIAAPPSLEGSSGYIMINTNGGLNQQRVAVEHLLFWYFTGFNGILKPKDEFEH